MIRTIRVLVAAPDDSEIEPAVEALGGAGLETRWRHVGSLDRLHTALADESADVVLLDPALPGVDGIEGIERVTTRHADLPIVVVTDALSDEEAVACMQAGAWDCVTRDRLAGLAAAVERAMEAARLRAESEGTRARLRLLERAVEASPVMVALTDHDGRIEYVNPAFTRATGYAEDEIVGETPRKLKSGAQPRELYDELWATILSGREWRGQLTNRRKDGSLFDVDLTIAPVTGADGEVTHFAALSLDISDRQRTQEALRRSERQLREAQRVARLGAYEVRLEDETWSSSGWMDEILGIAGEPYRKDLRGFLDLVHVDDRERLSTWLEDEVFGGAGRRDHEYRIVRPSDGEVRWVFDRGDVLRDGDGRPASMIGTIQDVTERKQAEEELQRSERKYRLIVQNVPGVVYRAHPDGSVDFLADPVDVCGYGGDEIGELEGGWLDVVHPDERDGVRSRREEMFGDARRRFDEYRVVQPDGEVRWVEDHKVSALDEAADRWVIEGILFDITERKTLENQLRQAQKMEAVGQLTGGIAHDFNNILTAISTNAEIVQSLLPAGSELEDDLTEILQAAERGATMIERLLQFSRQGMLSMESVAVGRVASDLRTMLRRLLPETIDLEIRDDTLASDRVRADVTAVEQMLVNLCTNARDAMPAGGTVRIESERVRLDDGYVATHPWIEPGDYIALAVSDSGMGMDRETQEKVFEPFFTTKPTGKGTGLGLAMVYGLVKQHLGMVHVYSELGTGTTVKLYFPVAEDGKAGNGPGSAEAEPAEVERAELGGETILVVEDEPAIQRATRRALESTGYTVLLAADGEEALEIFREKKDEVALVISDLVMPNLGGRQLTDVLRGEGESVPILLTSGYSPESAGGSFDLPEGVVFLQKPWSLSELLDEVRTLLDGERT